MRGVFLVLLITITILGSAFAARIPDEDDNNATTTALAVVEPSSPSSFLAWLYHKTFGNVRSTVASNFVKLVHYVGERLPLRGVASFLADLGVPGATSAVDMLTPRVTSRRMLGGRFAMHEDGLDSAGMASSTSRPSDTTTTASAVATTATITTATTGLVSDT